MSKLQKATRKLRKLTGMLAIALCLAICAESLGFVSLADRQGTITANPAAKVRKEASTTSDEVDKVNQGEKVTVLGEKKGEDGKTWYEVSVDGTTGYIRADLMEVEEAAAEVTKVESTAAKVSGNSKVRVRANASTTSDTVASIPAETALTVTGKATASDGKLWYEISCIVNGEQIDGFIRSDYVELDEEPADVVEPTPTEAPAEPVIPADAPYYVKDQDGVWFLVENNPDGEDTGWEIQSLFDGIEKNAEAYNKSQKTVGSQRVVIIILAFLLVAAAAGIGFLLFKVKDLNDASYYEDAEEEELRRREAAATRKNAVVMHTIGEEAPARPQRPVAPQGSRPVAPQGRPVAPQGARPAAPQGRPVAPQGARPVTPQGRPAAPQGRPAAPQGARPVAPQGRPVAPQGSRPAAPQGRPAQPRREETQGWQSKNFMAEDDEFDFEFLNLDE